MMSVKALLEKLKEKVNANPEGIKGMELVYQIDLSGTEGKSFQVKFGNNRVEVVEGITYKPACTLQLSDENFAKLVKGELNPAMAFMSGKLKIKGDLSLALKLQSVLKFYLARS
jgi:putative sterol carrier protein